jgi:tetratricopeptide (TPR) repeat protein
MLNEVVNSFEKAIEQGVENSVYLNYYGYTLIDKEIDVPKGIMIIKKALKTEPENTYYMDSLAWGYYKLGECDEAYNIMKKVIDIEGLKEKELIEHWDAISKKCKR